MVNRPFVSFVAVASDNDLRFTRDFLHAFTMKLDFLLYRFFL